MTKQLQQGPLSDELMSDGLSGYDILHLHEIIKLGLGNWYHADLMRALHVLMPHADSTNMARLRVAYPGSTLAYQLWYNGDLPIDDIEEGVASSG